MIQSCRILVMLLVSKIGFNVGCLIVTCIGFSSTSLPGRPSCPPRDGRCSPLPEQHGRLRRDPHRVGRRWGRSRDLVQKERVERGGATLQRHHRRRKSAFRNERASKLVRKKLGKLGDRRSSERKLRGQVRQFSLHDRYVPDDGSDEHDVRILPFAIDRRFGSHGRDQVERGRDRVRGRHCPSRITADRSTGFGAGNRGQPIEPVSSSRRARFEVFGALPKQSDVEKCLNNYDSSEHHQHIQRCRFVTESLKPCSVYVRYVRPNSIIQIKFQTIKSVTKKLIKTNLKYFWKKKKYQKNNKTPHET